MSKTSTQSNNDELRQAYEETLDEITKEDEQIILTPAKFIEQIEALYNDFKLVRIYYFHDKTKKVNNYSGWDNQAYIFLKPVAVVVILDEQKHELVDMKTLTELNGEDFGVKYSMSKSRRLIPAHKVNILEIEHEKQTFTTADGEEKEYHPCKTVLISKQRKFLDAIEKKYYESAKPFEFRPKTYNKKVISYEDMSDLVEKL